MDRGPKPTKGKAKPAVSRKSPKDEDPKVRDLDNRLAEALDQQRATSEILRLISSSPNAVRSVFEAIVESAARLCRAHPLVVFQVQSDMIEPVAVAGGNQEDLALYRSRFSVPVSADRLGAQAVRERKIIHVPHAEDPQLPEIYRDMSRRFGTRAFLIVPIVRDMSALGVILAVRREPVPFSQTEIGLLKTFADQAAIAIEDVRLVKELETKNHDLTDALAQQTAVSDILKIVSRSAFELQVVFEAIVERATRLCGASNGVIYQFDGDVARLAVAFNTDPELRDFLEHNPVRPGRTSTTGRVLLERRTIHIDDVLKDGEYRFVERMGVRTTLGVPMIRESGLLGVIVIWRNEVKPFTDRQVELVSTFADQAVIAIENVRLFNETKEALERQTATSEILRVISRSQTDVQPVFNTIVQSAVRLCAGLFGALFRFDGELLHMVAHHNYTPEALEAAHRVYPARPSRDHGSVRAIVERAVVHIPDVELDPEHQHRELRRAIGQRSGLFVPMLREGDPIGVIMVARPEPGPFSNNEIELLKTFADQAVIAIENVRLFKELEARTRDLTRSVGELRALGEIGQAISSTLDLKAVLNTIVARATELSGTDAGVVYEYDEQREVFVPRATAHLETEIVETMLATPVRKGEGATGRLAEVHEPIQIPHILASSAESRVRGALVHAGYRALLAVPLVREDRLLGGLTVIRKTTGEFAPEVIELLRTFATQSALAIQNARLFLEIEDKSRQLEAASQHKSEFLANMSHELRTPLNAIIGFSEVLSERMFGELNEKQEEYSKDIHASGQHLLSLINDILDLSKIEAGRMELELSDFHLPTALDSALTLVRERAGRRSIALQLSVDERLGQIQADERKVRQVVLNLLSNAIKFTPEGGRIEVRAEPKGGFVEVSVADTGVGIAPEDQEAVFEEFRQVGTADKKIEGTGLGLTLCRKFVELHGGRIWVKSQLGAGSTFTFTIPVRSGE